MRDAIPTAEFADRRRNIILIGMPGSGKSTVGVILAKKLACDFMDTDLLVQVAQGRPLQEIIDTGGYLALRRIEEETLLGIRVTGCVIATGGSAVHCPAAMEHLRATGVIVYLRADLATLTDRIGDFGTRGIARRPDQSFADLFAERQPLYERYADVTVESTGSTQEAVCERIMAGLGRGVRPGK